ncbi:MAG: MFS transporter [Actinomycetales bacterium]|nr:MFS transporter [Actinomycetales bacterium]
MAAHGNLRAVLAVRDFRYVFSVRIFGQFADGLLQSALATFVLFSPERQPNAASVAAAFAILFLPYSFVGPFAGVFLDEWRRRQVLVYANLLRAVLVVGVAALVWNKHDGLSLGVAVLVVLGVGRFVLAGLSASLPHVVAGPLLVTANALTPTTGTIFAAVGGVLGVAIRAAAGGGDYGSVFVLACAITSYVVAGLLASRLGKDALGPDEDTIRNSLSGVLRGLGEGFVQLARYPIAGRAVLIVSIQRIALGGLTVLALLLIRNTLNPSIDPDSALTEFALVTAAAAAGALIGAIVTPSMTRRMGFVRWTVIAAGQAAPLVTIGMMVGAYSRSMAALLIAGVSLGFANQAAKVAADTLVQREIDDDYLGRVFSIFDIAVNLALVLGITIVAFTAPASGVAPAVFIGIGVLLALNALWYSRSKA